MRKVRTRITGALSVCLLTGSLLGVGAATSSASPSAPSAAKSAAAEAAPGDCGQNEVCFWEDNDMPGAPTWRWSPGSGVVNLPPGLHDNVGSFVANADACFIDTEPIEKRKVVPGDYSNAYKADGKLGGRLDQVGPPC